MVGCGILSDQCATKTIAAICQKTCDDCDEVSYIGIEQRLKTDRKLNRKFLNGFKIQWSMTTQNLINKINSAWSLDENLGRKTIKIVIFRKSICK